jgi:hypothetical protein
LKIRAVDKKNQWAAAGILQPHSREVGIEELMRSTSVVFGVWKVERYLKNEKRSTKYF